MKRLSALAKRIALVATLGVGALGVTASTASAHERWHQRDRIVERCDPWGHHCRMYRCDWDGDDCYRVRGPDYYGPPPGAYYERNYYAPPPPPRSNVFLGVRVGH